MNEAKLTKKSISFLKSTGWNIIAFDYPQSGTGKNFKSSSRCVKENQKNKEHIIPDILAVKNKVMILF